MYPCSSSEFGRTGFKSCYLTWHGNDSEDPGFYVEPLSYCQEDFFYKSGFQDYRDGDDDVSEHADPSYRDLTPTHNASGSANLLGDYFSHFVGWDGYKFSEGCDAYERFNGLEMVKDPPNFVGWDERKFSEACDGLYDRFTGLEMVKDPYRDEELYEHSPWFDCDLGFQYRVDEDYGAAELKSRYSQSWESWDETGLYEKIFGNWHHMLISDTESRVEAGLA